MAQTLYRSFQTVGSVEGSALPMPFPELDMAGVRFRGGQVTMVASGQGGGKSAFLTNYLARARVPALYFSPDSDIGTIGPRMIATITERLARDVFDDLDAGRREAHLEAAKRLDHIHWSFETGLSYEDIQDHLIAYERVHGYYPQLIILDNLRDVYDGDGEGGEHQRHARTVDWFHSVARQTGAACVLLHHLEGAYDDPSIPPPLKAILGKVGKNARMSLHLFSPDDDSLGVVVAKNSNGRASPGAHDWHTLKWDRERQIIQ